MMKLLVLYAEIMPYNIICFEDFVTKTGGSIIVVSWGKDKKLTPYIPPPLEGVQYHLLNELDYKGIKEIIDSFVPSALYVVGRMEKDYLKASMYAKAKGIPVIGTSDNQYKGNWKQFLIKLLSKWLLKRYFDYMMVPGLYQYEYMRFLGFKRSQIIFPQYSADTKLFNGYFENKIEQANKKYILFTGRLDPIKGLDLLIEAFLELKKEINIDLKLLIAGSGNMQKHLPIHDDIVLLGFLDQTKLVDILPEVKFFCLPSRREPWGLVIHEFAAAGLPIITTDKCGAATAFVKNGYNGFVIKSNNKLELKKAITKMNSLGSEEISLYGKRSYELSKQINPALWTSSIVSVIKP